MEVSEILGVTNAAPTTTGAASTVEAADYVMITNSGTTNRGVSIQTAQSGTTLGNITILGSERVIIKKDPDHVIFAAHAEILLTKVNPRVI